MPLDRDQIAVGGEYALLNRQHVDQVGAAFKNATVSLDMSDWHWESLKRLNKTLDGTYEPSEEVLNSILVGVLKVGIRNTLSFKAIGTDGYDRDHPGAE